MPLENITKTIKAQEEYFRRRKRLCEEDNQEIYHEFNPLHIYCRLIEKGIEKREVNVLIKNYEEFFYIPLIKRSYKWKN